MPTKTGLDDPVAIAIPDANSADAPFRYERLYRALEKLPEKERACISLHYFEDLAIKDIAQILHIPIGTVKYHLSVGRSRKTGRLAIIVALVIGLAAGAAASAFILLAPKPAQDLPQVLKYLIYALTVLCAIGLYILIDFASPSHFFESPSK